MATKSKKASKTSAKINQSSKSKKRLGATNIKKIKGSAKSQAAFNLQKASAETD